MRDTESRTLKGKNRYRERDRKEKEGGEKRREGKDGKETAQQLQTQR